MYSYDKYPRELVMTKIIFTTFFLSFIFLSLFSSFKADIFGFSTDLIYRDSPASPFYDPSLTRFDRLYNAVRRSHMRANHFGSAPKNAQPIYSDLIPGHGEYLMKLSLGTPPVTMFAIVDTGSDLTWVQCAPCKKCSKQKSPLFDSKKSSTFKTYPYESSACHNLDKSHRSPNGTCEYKVGYAGFSYTSGILASETLFLSSKSHHEPVYFSGFTFGCSFNNSALDEMESGLVGLGGGPNSLVSQLKPSINGKFSYCFTDNYAQTPITSQINFGNDVEVSGTQVATTPIIHKYETNFYYLNLEGLSVGNHRIKVSNSSTDYMFNAEDIVIDSGTTLTYLFYPTYEKFVKLVREAMGDKTVPVKGFDLCYRLTDKLLYPKIQVHFTGASIDLKPINTFVQLSPNVTCLAFTYVYPILTTQIFGNVAQINFLVSYDIVKGIVSFKPAKCGRESY